MDEEALNVSIRAFLKMVGINSQREIERAIVKALETRAITDRDGPFPVTMTLRAPDTTARTSARRSADRAIYPISPAYPRSSHSRRKASSGKLSAAATPHRSNPSSSALALIAEEVIQAHPP